MLSASILPVAADVWKEAQTLLPGPLRGVMWGCGDLEPGSRHEWVLPKPY